MSRVAVIVLNHERADLTTRCLASLLALETQQPPLIYCVDNGSSSECREQITSWLRSHAEPCQQEKARFVWVEVGDNRGYSGGVNVALTHILNERTADHVWILNNDTAVEPDALSALVEKASSLHHPALIGATLLEEDAESADTIQCAGGCLYAPLTTITRPIYQGLPALAVSELPELEMDFVMGASMFTPLQLFTDIGLFDEKRFFLYCEELDLATRAREHGYVLGWAKDARIRHTGGATTQSRSIQRPQGSSQSFYFENLSTLRYTAKHHVLALVPAAVIRLGFKLLTTIFHGRWRELRMVFRAYAHFLLGKGWSGGCDEKPIIQYYGG